MKKLIYLMFIILCFSVLLPILAVEVDEDGASVIVETAGYTVHWKKGAQMGYMQAFVGGSKDSIIGTAGRAFYHSSNYGGGWKDWGAMLKWDIVEEKPGMVAIQYISKDAGQKEYTCVAYYYDSVPYIKHELTVTASGGAVMSFESDHEPQFETNVDMEGMKSILQPFPHNIYWVDGGFYGGTYGPEAGSASSGEWGGRNPGRMQLSHNNMGKQLKDGESQTITYYVAFGKGDEKDAADLVNDVQKDPELGKAVSLAGSLATTWGQVRVRH